MKNSDSCIFGRGHRPPDYLRRPSLVGERQSYALPLARAPRAYSALSFTPGTTLENTNMRMRRAGYASRWYRSSVRGSVEGKSTKKSMFMMCYFVNKQSVLYFLLQFSLERVIKKKTWPAQPRGHGKCQCVRRRVMSSTGAGLYCKMLKNLYCLHPSLSPSPCLFIACAQPCTNPILTMLHFQKILSD